MDDRVFEGRVACRHGEDSGGSGGIEEVASVRTGGLVGECEEDWSSRDA